MSGRRAPVRGSVWWADLGDPVGSAPGLTRPVVVMSANTFNRSNLGTVVVVGITSNRKLAAAPGNVGLHRGAAGLPKASVVNVSQVATIDKSTLVEELGSLDPDDLAAVEKGLRLSLSL